jgi:glycosyltransferase involved in cell wall biosynthesis
LKLIKAGHARGEKYRRTTLETIDRLGLRDDVVFTDFLQEEELARYYSNAGCFVLVSLYEGFGFPPLEAMACGCPVITSNTSSLPEVVGDAGILIDPYDTNSLVKAMRDVLTNSKLRDDMVRKGLAQAKKFTWERAAEQTMEVYNRVADR